VPLVDPPISAVTPGFRFGLDFAKYPTADCPPRFAVTAKRCEESKPGPIENVNDCCVWPALKITEPGIVTAESLAFNVTVCVDVGGSARVTVADPSVPVSGEESGVTARAGAGLAEIVLIDDVEPTRSSKSVTPRPR
jgi:hypothetical protein